MSAKSVKSDDYTSSDFLLQVILFLSSCLPPILKINYLTLKMLYLIVNLAISIKLNHWTIKYFCLILLSWSEIILLPLKILIFTSKISNYFFSR